MDLKILREFVNENSNQNDCTINKILGAGHRRRIISNPFEFHSDRRERDREKVIFIS